jgi:hypothetical protein
MSNEIRGTSTLQVTVAGLTVTGTKTATVTMTGSSYMGNSITIGTSSVALNTGSCADIRYLWIKNTSTASVDVSISATSQSFAMLRTDDSILLPGSASIGTYFVRSSIANADIQYVLVES